MYEYLGQLDHVRVIIEGLGQVDHLIGGVLLVAGSADREEGQSSDFGNGVAPDTTTGFLL